MGKPLRSFDFNFVPMPEDIWEDNISLSLSEFRFLGYLCKQVRFGEALEPLTDDEMMHGVFENGRRKDRGCGLTSRNGIKQAREALSERGWIEAKNISSDPSRPKWNYRLLIGKKGERHTVSTRQEVSQRDSEPTRQEMSGDDRKVSQNDSSSVTPRQLVSQRDTCNKEEENTKYLDKELEVKKQEGTKAKITAAPAENLELQKKKQANLDTWDLRRLQEQLKHIQETTVGSDRTWEENQRTAAFRAGLSPERHVQLLKMFFPNDAGVDAIYAPLPLFKPAESEEDIKATIERSLNNSMNEKQTA